MPDPNELLLPNGWCLEEAAAGVVELVSPVGHAWRSGDELGGMTAREQVRLLTDANDLRDHPLVKRFVQGG
jgi:hypothetical protein